MVLIVFLIARPGSSLEVFQLIFLNAISSGWTAHAPNGVAQRRQGTIYIGCRRTCGANARHIYISLVPGFLESIPSNQGNQMRID